MANVTLPTPVALAGGAFCILGGYLLGVVVTSGTSDSTTATVESYDVRTNRLCLSGDGVEQQEGIVVDGVLCGTWRRTQANRTLPREGDQFAFVSLSPPGTEPPEGQQTSTVIYGDVVD